MELVNVFLLATRAEQSRDVSCGSSHKSQPSDIGTSSYLGNMSDLGSSDLGPGMMEHTSDLDSVCPEDGGSKSQLWPL